MEQPQEQAYWDSVSSTFNESGQFALWRTHSDRVNQDLLERWFPTQSFERVLKTDLFDEAISDGLYPWLAQRADRVSGIDLSAEAVRTANERYPNFDCHHGDLRALPFETHSFDCIVSNSSLDHFPAINDLESAMAELFRVLKPGGTLLLTMDNRQNPVIWLRSVLPHGFLRSTGIVPYYTGMSAGRRKLHGMLKAKGFQIIKARGIMHCPRFLSVRRSAKIQARSARKQQQFLDGLARWERMANWPTAFYSAYFVAFLVKKT